MLTKNDVLSLRDLALSHLPGVQQQSAFAYTEGLSSRAALQVVASAPIGVAASPLSTSVERQAARLLHLVGEHPETHTEWLIDDVEGDDFPGELTAILKADAERNRPSIDQLLVEATRELCRLSGATLPPWMSAQVDSVKIPIAAVDLPRSTSPASQGATKHKLRSNSLDTPIKKAVKKANSLATSAVYLELRELALSGEPPFLGTTEGDALCYTNDKNEPAKLTKDALAKRLKKHCL